MIPTQRFGNDHNAARNNCVNVFSLQQNDDIHIVVYSKWWALFGHNTPESMRMFLDCIANLFESLICQNMIDNHMQYAGFDATANEKIRTVSRIVNTPFNFLGSRLRCPFMDNNQTITSQI